MLKSSKTAPKRAPQKPNKATEAPADEVSPKYRKMQALLRKWREEPINDAEADAWEETMRNIDESRPHRPLFS